ncbi:unnamed protein product [Gongylonema pulchrum]|uniref:JmjC domain-containing protein n=1 Tax=Gongylonema pulchrum TaxID=637853 RepID=A0A183EXG2_9BILA|nr:unnamed protein product [Gongylonema pulchrum]
MRKVNQDLNHRYGQLGAYYPVAVAAFNNYVDAHRIFVLPANATFLEMWEAHEVIKPERIALTRAVCAYNRVSHVHFDYNSEHFTVC